MATTMSFLTCCLIVIFTLLASGTACSVSKSNVYTTKDSKLAAVTTVIVEFTVEKCAEDANIYAEFDGKITNAVRSQDGSKYQVSWSGEHKKVASGTRDVRFYDEDGFAAFRKAHRSGEETSNIPALSTVSISHHSASQSSYLQSEFVAATVAIFVWYLAQTTRNKLQA